MQCLYASKILVAAYMNPRNVHWVETPFNRRLRDFFATYREDFGPFDPVPYVEEALIFKERSFEYLKQQDPIEALERIFNALIFSHAQVVRDAKGLAADFPVFASETFVGKYITAKISTEGSSCLTPIATCRMCHNVTWSEQEKQFFPVPLQPVLSSSESADRLRRRILCRWRTGQVCAQYDRLQRVLYPVWREDCTECLLMFACRASRTMS
jgi:hypothetical protein